MAGNAQVYTLYRLLVAEGSKPPVIGVTVSDAQAAVGVCWYIPSKEDTPAEPPPEGARPPSGSTTDGLGRWWVSAPYLRSQIRRIIRGEK